MRKLPILALALGLWLSEPAAADVGGASATGFREAFSLWQSGDAAATVNGPQTPAIVVSKAGDALGRPIDLTQAAMATAMRNRPAGASAGPISTIRPLRSAVLTSGFGMRRHPLLGGYRAHLGVDLAAPQGTPVAATSDGVVSLANWHGGYGLLVALEHGGGFQTRYGHLSRLNVVSGQRVRKGEVIGFVGTTGRSTGPHLHYETRMNGQAMNPAVLTGR